jgi:hypothetical protein
MRPRFLASGGSYQRPWCRTSGREQTMITAKAMNTCVCAILVVARRPEGPGPRHSGVMSVLVMAG